MAFGVMPLPTFREAVKRVFLTQSRWHVAWIAYFDNGSHIELDAVITTHNGRSDSLPSDEISRFRWMAWEETEKTIHSDALPEVVDLVGVASRVTHVAITSLTRIG